MRGVANYSEADIKDIAERITGGKPAADLLEEWLAQPGTQRGVKRLVYTGGHFEIELSAGGFVYSSVTQTTLEGAIRNVLGAAQFDE